MSIDSHFDERLALGSDLATIIVDAMPAFPKSFTEFYVIGLALQFQSNLQALLLLLANRFDSEAWSIGRSMVEMLIRLKWVYLRKSHAHWVIVAAELSDKRKAQRTRTRYSRLAIAAVDNRLANYQSLPKTGRYWDKSRGQFRSLPKIQDMAKECGMIQKYKGFFKLASDHLHFSHRILQRFISTDQQGNMTIVADVPPGDNLAFSSHYLLCLVILFVDLLKQNGFAVDSNRFTKIATQLHAIRPPNV
jgi:hypothetical protein